jgi:hypothetical protein
VDDARRLPPPAPASCKQAEKQESSCQQLSLVALLITNESDQLRYSITLALANSKKQKSKSGDMPYAVCDIACCCCCC